MTMLSDSVLVESKSARDHQLERMPHEAAHSILSKVKGLYFALWHGVGVSTTEQMKSFYEVSVDTVRSAFKRHKGELVSDGVRELTGKELKSLRDIGHGVVLFPCCYNQSTNLDTQICPAFGLGLRRFRRCQSSQD